MAKDLQETGAKTDAQLRTFETLDLLRGIAAIAVVCFHFCRLYGKMRWVSHGYLAVDLFFALSGFVLAYRYQPELDRGSSTALFLRARLIRLYPLYLVGLALGVGFTLGHFRTAAEPSLVLRMSALLLNLFFLPVWLHSFSGVPFWNEAFPFNSASWSLFSELTANVGHALFLRKRTGRTLLLLAACFGLALSVCILRSGTINFGFKQTAVPFGLIRIGFSYLIGMLVCRLWRWKPDLLRVPAMVPAGLLMAVLALPVDSLSKPWFDWSTALIFLPAILVLAVYSPLDAGLRSVTSLIATTSYAVYAIHLPLLFLFNGIWPRLTHTAVASHARPALATYLLIVMSSSLLLDRFYDVPLRARLRRMRGATVRQPLERPTLAARSAHSAA